MGHIVVITSVAALIILAAYIARRAYGLALAPDHVFWPSIIGASFALASYAVESVFPAVWLIVSIIANRDQTIQHNLPDGFSMKNLELSRMIGLFFSTWWALRGLYKVIIL